MKKKKRRNKKKLIILIILLLVFMIAAVLFLMLNNKQEKINSDAKNVSVITRSKIKYGDVNGDNKITVKDQSVILKHLSGKNKLTGVKLKAADVNLDGNVDNKDLALIRKYLIGAITKLPIRYGDANDDNKIDVNDLSAIQKHILRSKKLTGNGLAAADVNLNGKVTNTDANLLQKYLAGQISKLPIALNVQAEFLAVAQKELGNNGTKYKNFFGIDGDWCAMFVFWVAAHTSVDQNNNVCTSNTGSRECVYKKYINVKSAVVYEYTELMAKNNKFYHSKYYADKYGTYKNGDKIYRPQPGDLIFFIDEDKYAGDPKNCYGQPRHIGIVQEVTKTQIVTIEGNSGSMSHYGSKVERKSYKLNSNEILGYAHWG